MGGIINDRRAMNHSVLVRAVKQKSIDQAALSVCGRASGCRSAMRIFLLLRRRTCSLASWYSRSARFVAHQHSRVA